MTKLILACIFLATPLYAQTQPATQDIPAPAHPATAGQIHEYFAVTHSIETAHRLMDKMVDAMQATGAPYYPKAFWDDIRTSFAAFDLESPMVPAYQKYFSEDDMRTLLAFFKSPAGQRMLQAQPLIVSFSQEQLRKAGQEIGIQVYERHKDEIEAARAKYEESQHPQTQPDPGSARPPASQKQ